VLRVLQGGCGERRGINGEKTKKRGGEEEVFKGQFYHSREPIWHIKYFYNNSYKHF
jgi:hypothetical protein